MARALFLAVVAVLAVVSGASAYSNLYDVRLPSSYALAPPRQDNITCHYCCVGDDS